MSITQPSFYDEAFNQGKLAYKRGKNLLQNPYCQYAEPQMFAAWRRAWLKEHNNKQEKSL